MMALSRAQKERKVALLAEKERRVCTADYKYFLRRWVRTKDATNLERPVQPFPSPEIMPHPYYVADVWYRHRLLAVPKSRRMLMTWLFVALYTWDTVFHEGRATWLGSKKDDDAGELIDRVEHIIEPLAMRGIVPPFTRRRSPHKITVPSLDSYIQGFPSGPDQLRQHGASGVLLDEAAFQDGLEETLAASTATLLGPNSTARFTIISSVKAGSPMQALVEGNDEALFQNAKAA